MQHYRRVTVGKQKRDAAARKHQHQQKLKEIKVRPKTGGPELDFKTRRARQFLSSGNRVNVTVRFRGREHAHHDLGADQCLRIADALDDIGVVETRARMDGRLMQMILAPA